MKNSVIIGLKEADCVKITEKLQVLLANYSVFYQNTRGAHWNIKGDQFFTLHPKFEELYARHAFALLRRSPPASHRPSYHECAFLATSTDL